MEVFVAELPFPVGQENDEDTLARPFVQIPVKLSTIVMAVNAVSLKLIRQEREIGVHLPYGLSVTRTNMYHCVQSVSWIGNA